jgi:hypothetical protein
LRVAAAGESATAFGEAADALEGAAPGLAGAATATELGFGCATACGGDDAGGCCAPCAHTNKANNNTITEPVANLKAVRM